MEIAVWAIRYLLVAIITYLWLAYIDLVRGPRVEFKNNLVVVAVWPAYWAWLTIETLRSKGRR